MANVFRESVRGIELIPVEDELFNNREIFLTQALQILCSEAEANPDGRLKVPVRIIMDDFAASARIPDFDKIISVIRSREISVSPILQSLTQLESMYAKAEATTIINNCGHLLYLGCQDIDTAHFIGTRAFRPPDQVLCTDRKSAILITNGKKARTVTKIQPYSTMKPQTEEPEDDLLPAVCCNDDNIFDNEFDIWLDENYDELFDIDANGNLIARSPN